MNALNQGWVALRDAVIITLIAVVVGLLSNELREDGIPLVQQTEYQILVPCPETVGEAPALPPDDPALREPGTLLIDARPAADFSKDHMEKSRNVPYDYLMPTDPSAVTDILKSGARRVVVIGDGSDPDPGEHLAKELSGKGIRNVYFVRGGLPAIRAVGGRP
ncbi:MAG: rhodanese-like domain-containing protein [Myxococcales bacterium]|nr:rhodanese-like domain-containing protein [Myxococcales bacterium]